MTKFLLGVCFLPTLQMHFPVMKNNKPNLYAQPTHSHTTGTEKKLKKLVPNCATVLLVS